MKEKCQNHPEVDAPSFCHSCGRYFCSECLTEGREYYYCSSPQCQFFLKNELERKVEGQGTEQAPKAKFNADYSEVMFGDNESIQCEKCGRLYPSPYYFADVEDKAICSECHLKTHPQRQSARNSEGSTEKYSKGKYERFLVEKLTFVLTSGFVAVIFYLLYCQITNTRVDEDIIPNLILASPIFAYSTLFAGTFLFGFNSGIYRLRFSKGDYIPDWTKKKFSFTRFAIEYLVFLGTFAIAFIFFALVYFLREFFNWLF